MSSPRPTLPTGGSRPLDQLRQIIRFDVPASLVVFLVAVPLSLGIAVASGAPVAAGLIAAAAGGIVAGLFGGSPLQVSGPAAGMTVVVARAGDRAMPDKHFWNIRARNYDRHYWTKDAGYIEKIIKVARFSRNDLVLDIGTGTGAMARSIRPHVRHVVGLDFSDSMLKRGKWDGISMVKWDLAESLFQNRLFDKIVGRMVFHHILDNMDRAFLRCFDLLKSHGKLIVAEGIPPSEDQDVIDWYTEMFKHKERRRTFSRGILVNYFVKNGFRDVKVHKYKMKRFNINNWLVNSGLDEARQKVILDMHVKASPKIKAVYNMTVRNGVCLVDTDNLIVVGRKP